MTVSDIQQAANDWIFDINKRASMTFMLFGNQHSSELTSKDTSLLEASAGHGQSFFPYGQDRKVDVIASIDGIRAKKQSLEYLLKNDWSSLGDSQQ